MSQPLRAHCGVSKFEIITASNSSPPVATDAVIFARASFSERLTNRTLIPGFSASNFGESSIASSICGLDTIAIVIVRAPSATPSAPAPAHPETASASTATTAPNRHRRDGG